MSTESKSTTIPVASPEEVKGQSFSDYSKAFASSPPEVESVTSPTPTNRGVIPGALGTAFAALFGGLRGAGEGMSHFRYSPVSASPHIAGAAFKPTPYQFEASKQIALPFNPVSKKQ